MSDADVDIANLKRQVADLTREIATLAAVRVPADDDPERGRAVGDAMWKCGKCASLLAFYDPRTDIMRVRYKDFMLYTRSGPGGFVQVICRGCGEINTKQYMTEDEVKAEQQAEREAARRRSR
jgi:hypothetical protein